MKDGNFELEKHWRDDRGLPRYTRMASLRHESILLLCNEEGRQLSNLLESMGAKAKHLPLSSLSELYLIPIEQFTTVVFGDTCQTAGFDVEDISRLLRKADNRIRLVWATRSLAYTKRSLGDIVGFCNSTLQLPAKRSDVHRAMLGNVF